MADKNRAKTVVLEILRQAGGEVVSTTRLHKAFYFAHLYYCEATAGFLSDWPIVKSPTGPGISQGEGLVDELAEADLVARDHVPVGPFHAVRYRLTGKHRADGDLSPEAARAVERAVQLVQDKSVVELSELTREYSRSWNLAQMGEELNVYLDLIPEDEYQRRKGSLETLEASMEEVWNPAANARPVVG